jgi:hypothetical protein
MRTHKTNKEKPGLFRVLCLMRKKTGGKLAYFCVIAQIFGIPRAGFSYFIGKEQTADGTVPDGVG